MNLSRSSIAALTLSCALVPCSASLAADTPPLEGRFTPLAGFQVQEVVEPGSTGSLVAMVFNETGDIIASREQGPLLLVRDKDHDGRFESISTFCDKVTNCQGILPWAGHVFAVGNGPSGTAFYRLTDADGDGQAEKVETLFKFRGNMGEHGPHAPVLGPDGLIYIIIGNHAGVAGPVAATSPHHHYHDRELFNPKYEDANGHAAGIKAPGGTVVRTDTNGSFLEMYCGGFRNAYDHAFNRDGELFTYDSDMEWDVALPWYRPTRVNHLTAGSEFGWRSGWSKWPNYFVDSLPTTLDIGRGSPTGVVFYDHTRFGKKYEDAFFMCDWSQGRILAVTMGPADGSYRAKGEIFLEGRPLNCSDIDVGPDGWLYFTVGGRNTAGSIFRIVAEKPAAAPPVEAGIMRAVRQPQLTSAWARRAVADVKKELGDQWGPALTSLAVNEKVSGIDRARALELMQLYGPAPANDLLVQLSRSSDATVRGRATCLLGVHTTPASNERLVALLDDPDATVRRRACEALVRAKHPAPLDKLTKIMGERHPFVAWAATRAIETQPVDTWRKSVLDSKDPRVFILGGVALTTLEADHDTCRAILEQSSKWLDQKLGDDDFVGLLRVMELAVHQGGCKPAELTALRDKLSDRYPARDWRAGRELCRLLVMLEDPSLAPKLVAYLESKAPMEERIQAAMLARFLNVGWTPELRSRLLEFFGVARLLEGGNSYKGYLTNGANDILKNMPQGEQLARIRNGATDPVGALAVVHNLSGKLSAEQTAELIKLDRALVSVNTPQARELGKAVVTALGHGEEPGADYLNQVFESSPDRRVEVAQALATYSAIRTHRAPDFAILVRALPIVEGAAARDVLRALTKFQQKDDKPLDQRQVILLGLKLKDQGGREAVQVLQHWTGQKPAEVRDPEALATWQKWFSEKYPDQPEAVLPVEAQGNRWTYAQLIEFLASESGQHGNPERGTAVFEKAQCIKCHRYGTRGEGIGPDLSNVASRFQRKEVLESVIFPSQVISDQFAARTVVTTDGKSYTGLVGPTGDGVVVLQPNADKVAVAKAEIEEIVPSKKSAMPEGLFNTLSLEEIADLFAYLGRPAAK